MATFIQEVQQRITTAMREGNTAERDLLKVALGELQTVETRQGKALSDEEGHKVLRKMVKSAKETIELVGPGEAADKAKAEIKIIESLLPATLDAAAIEQALAPVADAIRGAGNDGQATGIAMKHLKSTGAVVSGQDVSMAVKAMRA